MKGPTFVWHMERAVVRYIDRDILKSCTPEKWDELYSPIQLESALKHITECAHHAGIVANILDTEPVDRLEVAAQRIKRALHAAYSGSAEHGSFFRNATGEYVPSVFVIMNELEDAIASLRK